MVWQRQRKAKTAESSKGRKHRRRTRGTTHKDIDPRLPLVSLGAARPSEHRVSATKGEPSSPNSLPRPPSPPDPIRLHGANVIGAVAALYRLPEDFDFDRMAQIVDASEHRHLRSCVRRGMDVLSALWKALGDAIEQPGITGQGSASDIIESPPLNITEQLPPGSDFLEIEERFPPPGK